MSQQQDLTYIRKVVRGNSQAYAFLVDKYQAMAYTLAFRMTGDAREAEEVSQDAFVKAYQALPTFRQEAAFSTWLYRIVYNTAVSRTRKKKTATVSLDTLYASAEPAATQDIFQTLVQEDQKKYIEAALSKLSGQEASFIHMYYVLEKSMEEIGAIAGLNASHVRVRLFRARKKLYGYLHRMLQDGKEDLL